ncbi:e3 ubiquitin-protein ligase MIB2 [Trypanosoma grayi]|uniref:e3 ubiquitin-protein ligase MIB2 n=1 Tax=Trypanosoma grayi TaxID=71804 RepID=UPI0004F473C5|nr:e3 ubiquitin-protein ligase MIB2 [Trypanosoma grayi]KEG11872.1 e3 ubiquitin-protein ligase MIB2 [Trypanosoma grayi]
MMENEDCEYREATNLTEAFLDCARYNDHGDARALLVYLTETPSLIEAKDEQGRTAVHVAAANGHISVLEMLMEFGPTPDVPNHEGNTALHFAALNNQLEAARLLLARGWHTTERNAFDKTPIQLIYGKNFEAMETLLLEHDEEVDRCVRSTVGVSEDEQNTTAALEEAGTIEGGGGEREGTTPGSGIPHISSSAQQPFSEKQPSCGEAASAPGPSNSPPQYEDPTKLLGSADVDGVE